MLDFMPFAGGAITLVVVAFSLFFMFRVFGGLARGTAERDRLMRVGIPARARILGIQMGGMTVTVGVDRQLQVIMSTEVHADGRPPFPAQITALISELAIPQIQPGAWAAVRIDPVNPSNLVVEATGVGPPGTPGPGMSGQGFTGQGGGGFAQPFAGGYGAPQQGYAQGAGYGAAPANPPYGAQPAWGGNAHPMAMGTPVRGFRMPLGAKIGLGIGALGLVIAVVAVVVTTSWTSGLGGPSEVCEKAAKCCRKMAGGNENAACENFTKQNGPIADTVCEQSLKSFRESKSCK